MFFLYSVEAELEYLKIAQDLEMYGISYFHIRVSIIYSYLSFICLLRVLLGIADLFLLYFNYICHTSKLKIFVF